MRTIRRTLAAASLGLAVASGAALAQDVAGVPNLNLNDKEKQAVQILKTFQKCVATEMPKFEAALAPYRAAEAAYYKKLDEIEADIRKKAGEAAKQRVEGAKDVLVKAAEALGKTVPETEAFLKMIQSIEFRTINAQMAKDATLPEAPKEPVGLVVPEEKCQNDIVGQGVDVKDVIKTLDDLQRRVGRDAYKKLTAPEAP